MGRLVPRSKAHAPNAWPRRKARHLKIYVVLGKMKNEDSRGLRRLYIGRNSVPKFQDILL